EAVVKQIIEEYKKGRPVLVGTISIEKSERLSQMLKRRNIPHSVLNAKYHEKEAEIVSQAGQGETITIATNMAGRGTDIVLGPGVADKGGLCVLGTERHEARRIDNQLRGRCGRQGDPGMTKFYISLEDDLMRLFGSDRISGVMQKLGMQEGEEIQHPLVTKAIETAQKRVETRNFEIRKHLLEYDDVMNRQRELIYAERDRVLKGEKVKEHVFEMIEDVVEGLLAKFVHPDWSDDNKNPEGLAEALGATFGTDFKKTVSENMENLDWLRDAILEKIRAQFELREREFTPERMGFLVGFILLQVIDTKWKDHLYNLDNLKDGIGLRAYGQRDPLVEYKREAFNMFEAMVESIKDEAIELIFRVQAVREEKMPVQRETPKAEYLHPESQGLATAQMGGTEGQRRPGSRGGKGPSLLNPDEPGPSGSPDQKPEPQRRQTPKVGRNDPCPCGSGKKYKKCHGANE
ncbi:MAG: SEC-C metal-binding domain-containing protein, partial [Candidatus Omnitrophica bacterium]|nr:SEC-C metal-binding domain-containing protein [Candidatus Omnitrophota bacterium]